MSVRVTRKIRRVLDTLARGEATAKEISERTNINFPGIWDVITKLESEGWVKDTGETFVITQTGRDGLRAEDEKVMAHSRPGPRRDNRRRR